MDKVIQIGDFTVYRKDKCLRALNDCQHLKLELNDHGEIIQCLDCKKQISAYWAFKSFSERWNNKIETLNHEAKRLKLEKEAHIHLIAARKLEKAWRSRDTVPSCPHCYRGIFPADRFGESMINKEIELRKRKVDKLKQPQEASDD